MNPRIERSLVVAVAAIAVAVLTIPRQAHAANAAPLGLEIGVATLADVKSKLGPVTKLGDAGTNKFTGGTMLKSNGQGLGVDGLSDVVFVFDKADLLQGVLMTLPKNFKPTYERLQKKYTLVSKQIPFVGDTSAKFSQGSSQVLLNAPHLSFEMTLNYLSNTLMEAFKNRSAKDQTRHDKEQTDKL